MFRDPEIILIAVFLCHDLKVD